MAPAKSSPKPESRPNTNTQNQQRTKSTTLPSTSSPTAGRDTFDRQRGQETQNHFLSTTAYTQHRVTQTFSTEPQRPSANNAFVYPTTIDHRHLAGEASQTFGVSGRQHEPHTMRIERASMCPYHGSTLQGGPPNARSGQGLHPMDRYLAEGPTERYAVLHRPDAGNGSTHNGCRCLELMQGGGDAKGHPRK